MSFFSKIKRFIPILSVVFLGLFSYYFFTIYDDNDEAKERTVKFKTIYHNHHRFMSDGVKYGMVKILRSSEEVEESWLPKSINKQKLANLIANVDFNKEDIIIVPFHEKSSSTGDVRVSEVRLLKNNSLDLKKLAGITSQAACSNVNAISYSFLLLVTEKMPRDTSYSRGSTNFFMDGCEPVISSIDDWGIEDVEFKKIYQGNYHLPEGKEEIAGVTTILQSKLDVQDSWLPKIINKSELNELLAKVDFSKQIIMFEVASPTEFSTGNINVESVKFGKKEQNVRVIFDIGISNEDCFDGRGITSPFVVLITKKPLFEIRGQGSASSTFRDKCKATNVNNVTEVD